MAENIPGRTEQDRDEPTSRPRARRPGVEPTGETRTATSTNFDPSTESDYWRTNYQHRPYVEPGASFDEYAPAYQYGWEMYSIHGLKGRTFEQAEPELRQKWGGSGARLTWEKAKDAVKDAWDRVRGGGKDGDSQFVSTLNHLCEICMDGVKGFRTAAEKLNPATAQLFEGFARERDQCAAELRQEVLHRGGKPPEPREGDTAGAIHRGWINLKKALGGGEHAILEECERGEDSAVKAYQDALNANEPHPPQDIEAMLNRHYAIIKHAHDQVKELRDAAKQ